MKTRPPPTTLKLKDALQGGGFQNLDIVAVRSYIVVIRLFSNSRRDSATASMIRDGAQALDALAPSPLHDYVTFI